MEENLVLRARLSRRQQIDLDYKVRTGAYRRIMTGVYSINGGETWLQRVHAAQMRFPQAVLCGPTAAKLHFWDDLDVDQVHLTGVRMHHPPDWLQASRGKVPAGLRKQVGSLTLTSVALTVLDLIPSMGGRAIDEALRRRKVTLDNLREALVLTPSRADNSQRFRLIQDSRDTPWSALEREGHQVLRRHRITDWHGNYAIQVGWETFYADVAFPSIKLIIEFDGWSHHRTRRDLDRDNRRQNLLVLAGWTVLRFTSTTLADLPDQVRRYQRRHARLQRPLGLRNRPRDDVEPAESGSWNDLGDES